MRSFTRTLAIVVLFSSILTVGESVRSLFNKGVKAEARQDYEAAYEFYKEAYTKSPTDLKYRVPYERTRFLAAAVKVRKAQRLRDQGKLQEALELFQKAAEIDPSNELAAQEVRRTQQIMKGQPTGENKPAPPPPEDPLRKRLSDSAAAVTLNEMSNVPLAALKINNETKVIYETIGKIAGINVLFDPDYQSRKLSLELNGGVTFQEALDIVAMESRTFWRPVTPNTIFIAADTPNKRREIEQSVIKTFYLGNVSTPTDLQDVVNAIRTILEVQRIQQIPSQNAIVVRGTPDQMVLAQKMIDDIDKAKPEVVVDVIVAQVRRDKVRDIGLLPPQNATVALQGATTTTPATGGTTPPTPTTTPGGTLNFNDLQHLNSTNYAVSIDPLHARALFTDDATRIIQNPQIRAGDGLKATLKIGDRIPIATGSFGTPLGVGTGVGVGLGVNTQFQYLEVGVNIDITSKVHPGNEISMKVLLEISSQSGTANIGGITQPIISQRKIEHEIRLKDGEMNLLGGILEESELKSISGTPILGQIPILGRLFSQEKKEKVNNEIVFLLVPHIVRGQELSELNHRAFDVGTATGIGLRVNPKPAQRSENNTGQQPASAPSAQAAPAPGTPMLTTQTSIPPGSPQSSIQPQVQPQVQPTPPGQSQQQIAPVSPQQAPPVSGQPSSPAAIQQNPGTQPATGVNGPVTLQLAPGSLTPMQGASFAVNVVLAGGQDVFAVPVQISYDPQLLQFLTVSNGEFLTKDGQPVALVHRDDGASGTLILTAQRPPGAAGVSGDGTVFNLIFRAKAKGSGVVAITIPGARNSQNQPIQAMGSQASVTVN